MSFLKRLFAPSAPRPMRLFDPRAGWPRTARDLVAGQAYATYVLESPGRVDVVGEGNYQAALTSIGGGKTTDGARFRSHEALLVPEPWNAHDPNAVRVFLANDANKVSDVVGYLSKADAVAYRPVIDRIGAAGRITAVKAEITGGWDRGGGDTGSFGVVLALGTPAACMAEIDATPVEDIAGVALPAS